MREPSLFEGPGVSGAEGAGEGKGSASEGFHSSMRRPAAVRSVSVATEPEARDFLPSRDCRADRRRDAATPAGKEMSSFPDEVFFTRAPEPAAA